MQKQKKVSALTTPQTPPTTINPQSLLRLPHVLELIPVSRSSWWAGVKSGRYPAPIKLGAGTTCWRASLKVETISYARNKNKLSPRLELKECLFRAAVVLFLFLLQLLSDFILHLLAVTLISHWV